MDRPEFKTLKSYSIEFGTRNFLEVALKSASEGKEENLFISISKGYSDQEGNKKYKRSLGFAIDNKVIDFLIKSLPELKKEIEKATKGKKPENKEEKKKEAKKPAKKK
jgi:hypothetical protein